VDDLRVNGERVKPWLDIDSIEEKKPTIEVKETIKDISIPKSNISYNQQIKKQLLQHLRGNLSSHFRQKAESILPDQAINEIISIDHITKVHLKKILESDKKVKQIGDEIIDELEHVNDFIVGQVIDTRYQSDEFSYDQVKMVRIDDGSVQWYDTKKELPKKGSFVAVSLNKNWFNSYLIIEESDVIENVVPTTHVKYSNTETKTTKELSDISGVSSRDINSTLVSFGLMEKNGNDWYATQKGEKLGAIQREGQYGKFLMWPESILSEIKLN
jgi:endonuclease III-like uncharacterized protein